MSKSRHLNNEIISEIIEAVFNTLLKHFEEGHHVRNQHTRNSKNWKKIENRLGEMGACLSFLNDARLEKNLTNKEKRLLNAIDYLEEMSEKYLQEIKELLDLVKSLTSECVGEA
jgi:hypothetical protein